MAKPTKMGLFQTSESIFEVKYQLKSSWKRFSFKNAKLEEQVLLTTFLIFIENVDFYANMSLILDTPIETQQPNWP